VQKSKVRLFESEYTSSANGFTPVDITVHVPEIGEPEITRIIEQRQPDTRLHCVRSDGKVALMMYDKAEEVLAWILIETDGDIEDVVVLPGTIEDAVYYVVKRTINSATVRYLEKWSIENEVIGASTIYNSTSATVINDLPYPTGMIVTVRDSDGDKVENLTVTNGSITLSSASTYADIRPAAHKLADAHLRYSGSSATGMTGLSHLEGETVVVRGDGKDLGTYTVSSGAITLSEAVKEAVIGMSYTGKWKSGKLSHLLALNISSTKTKKNVRQLGLIMHDVDQNGITYGPDFDNLDNLPGNIEGADVAAGYIHQDYDYDMMAFLGMYTTDARICLQSAAPNPATILAIAAEVSAN
jgi:hypothetical protein